MTSTPRIAIIGAGLAGSEAALQLAKRGLPVRLYEMKPERRSPAHHQMTLAEIVCSNSFGAVGEGSASGLLKAEMAALGCELLAIAHQVAVPAGKALAVDRDRFSQAVTDKIAANPLIELVCQDVSDLPGDADWVLVATGPLTSAGLVETFGRLLERQQLYFFDAASPIVTRESINMDIAWVQDRYNKSAEHTDGEASYINCPLDKAQYDALYEALLTSERTELKDFEKESAQYFESCLPIEVIASRGYDTLRYGPFKPVGLSNPHKPHTGEAPYAVVQLRQDNQSGTLYNLVGCQTNIKWGAQKAIIQMIPGLENADIVRYGVMHRNTFIHSPEVLESTLQLRKHPNVLFAGQLTGTEGYTESIATGMWAAINLARLAQGEAALTPPQATMLGALLRYITRPEAIGKGFQPINSNWGILPSINPSINESPLDPPMDPKTLKNLRRNKPERNRYYAERSLKALAVFIESNALLTEFPRETAPLSGA